MSSTGLLAGLGRSWWVLVVYGLIAVLFGISALVWPGKTAVAIAWAFGVMALAEGLISAVALFRKDVAVSKGWLALYAVASIVFGITAIMHPLAVAGILLLLLALWLIVAGIWRIILAIRIRKEIEGEWLIALSGVLAIALGVMFFSQPAAGLVTVALWMGVVALVYGVLQIIAGFRLRKLARSF